MSMLVYNDIYSWEGFGGALRLGKGECRLRIYDLDRNTPDGPKHIRPIITVVSDLPQKTINDMTVRSCAGHIATNVVNEFHINPNRMLWVEYYPESTYGVNQEHVIPERFASVDFVWRDGKAIMPKWKALPSPLVELVIPLVHDADGRAG